tara:strand:- start:642 stop:770 length:129 start_codon:yes stop_codon:yes gene_type:complete
MEKVFEHLDIGRIVDPQMIKDALKDNESSLNKCGEIMNSAES